MPLQVLPCPSVVLFALRAAVPQAVDVVTNPLRQGPDAVSQTVQVQADFLKLLQADLRIVDASAKRHHLGPLAIQQSLRARRPSSSRREPVGRS
ncbi:hypothetical protein PF005_g11448 [Phytophthora fragariae]|uniref:Secreted protein n=1 Tax=Phytophthora fragariae TaxID=53985 RepID=A0A6A3U447_9STRA|nr:hypothetical protein PF009_g11996 [Phytophthora fragariae]KAE9009824.1 hypothetical protein PF011_g10089 [Phytophthora fragariae]KAE9065233.1 hypothetical protein PF007_g28914 [Phytophthora fragariae]KAE9112694.1 hypothetical protein PF010_g10355 [Phytophthora fragariae]KAE9144785.1 hypothetical protein PF006_g10310 [Phytophthora fragariae]